VPTAAISETRSREGCRDHAYKLQARARKKVRKFLLGTLAAVRQHHHHVSQVTRAIELTAESPARLLARHRSPPPARTMLADIYNWFTEGFDTADLKDAKALLDELC